MNRNLDWVYGWSQRVIEGKIFCERIRTPIRPARSLAFKPTTLLGLPELKCEKGKLPIGGSKKFIYQLTLLTDDVGVVPHFSNGTPILLPLCGTTW